MAIRSLSYFSLCYPCQVPDITVSVIRLYDGKANRIKLGDDMNILSFDTTLNRCSVAVLTDDQVLAHRFEALQRGHAEALMPMVSAALDDAGLAFPDINLVGVTTGPGTFTGQRVGLSAARGFGVAQSLPVQGVGSLPAIALAARQDGCETDILVVLDARRGQYYVQNFAAEQSICLSGTAPLAIETAELAKYLPAGPCTIVGTGVTMVQEMSDLDKDHISFSTSGPEADAIAVARLARDIVACDGMPEEPPAPLYLRAPDAKLPGGKSLP